MAGPNGYLSRYLARRWCAVPVHRPNTDDGTCSCGRTDCAKPGKHPDGRFWPAGSSDATHFADRNIGVKLGPESQNQADVDLDCGEAVQCGPALLPATDSAFGRGGRVTHALYAVPARDAAYLKLQDPVLAGERATIVERAGPSGTRRSSGTRRCRRCSRRAGTTPAAPSSGPATAHPPRLPARTWWPR